MTAKTTKKTRGTHTREISDHPKILRCIIKEVERRQKRREMWYAFDERQRVAEEKQFGELPDQGVSNISFEEKLFGSTIPPGHKFCQTNAGVTYDLSSIVVSIALFDGDKMLFACSGIPIGGGESKLRLTRFVTSARLIKAFKENRYKDDKLRIAVGLPDNTTADGLLGLYDDNIAIVTSIGIRAVHPVDMNFQTKLSHGPALVAGRTFSSRDLKTMDGSLIKKGRGTFFSGSQDLTEAVLGGPLIGDDNIFLGMIIDISSQGDVDVSCSDRALFIPSKKLYDRLKHFQIINHKVKDFRGYKLPEGVSTIYPSAFMKTIYRLKSYGYPLPPPLVLELNGELVNGFEEHFGECLAWEGYPFGEPPGYSLQCIWMQLPKRIVTNISRRVVSLASFHGCVRHFTCTGLLIEWPGSKTSGSVILTSASLVKSCGKDDIERDLRIEVYFPPKRANGNLEFYNLNYNVAIISVKKKFVATRPEDIFKEVEESRIDKVLAIGRDIRKGLLMASMGDLNHRKRSSKLDCKELWFSTCKIKKVGIGGPLINLNGSFVGMNFYDGSEVTPFLPQRKIAKVLRGRKYDRLPSECGLLDPLHIEDGVGGKTTKNEWPVPEPYWYHGMVDVSMHHMPKLVGRVLN